MPRVLTARFMHETNTFSRVKTDMALIRHRDFHLENEIPQTFRGDLSKSFSTIDCTRNAEATQNDFDRDRYHCVRETLASGAGAQAHAMAADSNFGRNGGLFGALAPAVANARGDAKQMALFNMCMQAKGYHQ